MIVAILHTPEPSRPDSAIEPPRDLGFGQILSDQSGRRLLNRDGTFNAHRDGLGALSSFSPFHDLLTTSWPRFLGLLSAGYLAINLVFAVFYTALGPGSLFGSAGPLGARFADAFFFSVQTFAGVGYGRLNPATFAADVVVTVESLFGLLGLALSTGLVFARFSRPTARILWSPNAVIAPFRDGTALMLRIANARRNQLIELQAKVFLTFLNEDGHRRYHRLGLERDSVTFFPLSWTIVHPILEDSPVHGLDKHDLEARHAEILVLLTGTDESMNQTVHTRCSYVADEILCNVRFENIFKPLGSDGILRIDLRKLGATEPV
jgi:inward rectifier potassium channel